MRQIFRLEIILINDINTFVFYNGTEFLNGVKTFTVYRNDILKLLFSTKKSNYTFNTILQFQNQLALSFNAFSHSFYDREFFIPIEIVTVRVEMFFN